MDVSLRETSLGGVAVSHEGGDCGKAWNVGRDFRSLSLKKKCMDIESCL